MVRAARRDARAALDRHIEPRLGRLEHLQDLCDDWIERHADHFDLFAWQTLAERYGDRKAFAEAALYLYVAQPFGDDQRALPNLRTLVTSRVNDSRYANLILRHVRDFDLYCLGPMYVAAVGLLSERTTAAIANILNGRGVWAIPRRPSQALSLWHFCTVYGYEACPVDPRPLARLPSLKQPPGAIEWTLDDAYALTHTVMYRTNFGVPHKRFSSRIRAFDLTGLLDGLILRFMAEHNLDIVIELVAAGVLQRQMRPSVAALALDWVAAQADSHGYVPHRDIQLTKPTNGAYTWADNYHTTLMAGSLARSLRRDWRSMALGIRCAAVDEAALPIDEVLTLGQALSSLAVYELGRGAALLQQLIGTPTQLSFSTTYTGAVNFVLAQQTSSGQFGFRTDDPTATNSTEDDSDRCRALISAVVTASASRTVGAPAHTAIPGLVVESPTASR